MEGKPKIKIPKEKIAEFCRKHHIRKLSFFGSVIGERFTQDSNVDVLVEFEEGQIVGLLRLAGMEIELSEILGRKADLRTPTDLSRFFRAKCFLQQRFSMQKDNIIYGLYGVTEG